MIGKSLVEFDPRQTCNLIFYQKNDCQNLKHVTECGVILFNFNMNEILLVLQRISNKWGFPKGHMNINELHSRQFFNCAKRELYEETNIDLRVQPHTKFGTLLIYNKLFYIIGLKRQALCARANDIHEISEIKWVNRHHLCNFVKQNACNITLRTLF